MNDSPHPAPDSAGMPIPLRTLYELLRTELGGIDPWPAESDLEYVCGAVLVQNTTWGSALRSLDALRDATAFDADRMLSLDEACLIDLIRPSGFMKAKARALRAYATWLTGPEGRVAPALGDDALRAELMKLPGFGPETTDVVALMVYDRPRFIFDAYARRLLRQAGHDEGRGYETSQRARRRPAQGLPRTDHHRRPTRSCSGWVGGLRSHDRRGVHEPVTVQVL